MISIKYNTLAALLTHAAIKDIRYYLRGVYFNPTRGHAAATDGHRLAMVDGLQTDGAGEAFILPCDAVKTVLDSYKAMKKYNPLIELDETGGKVSVKVPSGALTFDKLDGTFPDYLRVIPQSFSSESTNGTFNYDYLSQANEALRMFTNAKKDATFKLYQRSAVDSAVMYAENDDNQLMLIVIMPVRANEDDIGAVNSALTRARKFSTPAPAPAPASEPAPAPASEPAQASEPAPAPTVEQAAA